MTVTSIAANQNTMLLVPRGPRGPQGLRGPAGTGESTGTSLMAILPDDGGGDFQTPVPGPRGHRGARGLRGVPSMLAENGEPGIGFPGKPGKDGAAGARGSRGLPGAPALLSEDGEPGIGIPGKRGVDGAAGAAGARGSRGLPGAPGMPGNDGGEALFVPPRRPSAKGKLVGSLLSIAPSGTAAPLDGTAANVIQIRTDGASAKSKSRMTFCGNNTGYCFSISMNNAGTLTDMITLADNGNCGVNLLGTIPAVAWEVNGQIRLWTNSLLATPIAGTHEYDGKAPHFSPTYGVRGVIPAYQFSKVTASGGVSLSDGTGAQSFLPSGKQSFPVQAGIYYRFRARILLDLNTTNPRIVSFLIGGSATFSWIRYRAVSMEGSAYPVSGTEAATIADANTAVALTSSTNNQYVVISVEGDLYLSSAGTIQPQIQFSAAPGGTDTCMRGSYFELCAFGNNAASTGLS